VLYLSQLREWMLGWHHNESGKPRAADRETQHTSASEPASSSSSRRRGALRAACRSWYRRAGSYDRGVGGFEEYAFGRVATALKEVPADQADDVYVVSLWVNDEEDDPRRPTILVGFNTEARVAESTALGAEEDEARWNFAYWLQNELAVLGDSERDPEGAGLCREWIQKTGLWFSDDDRDGDFDAATERGEEITDKFVALCVRLVRRLHDGGVIERSFGRPVPAVIHELEYYDEIADQNRAANPPELIAQFTRWVGSQ
jgi:hypothetical protein